MGIEKRRHERVSTAYPVRVTVGPGGGEREGLCVNLGEGGLQLQMGDLLSPGAPVILNLDLPPMGRTIRAKAKVVWSAAGSSRPRATPAMGLRFVELGERERLLIARTIQEEKTRGSSGEALSR
jgi:hypothetical protein